MTTNNPASGNDIGLSHKAFLDAGDHLADARNFVELIAMAHRHIHDSDTRAVAAGAYAALQSLAKADELLESLRPALGLQTFKPTEVAA